MTSEDAIQRIPYARFLGVRIESGEHGSVCVLPFRDDLVGNKWLPALHGGVVGAFLELTAFVQLFAQMTGDRVPRPISFATDFLRSVGPRDTLCRAEIVKQGRRIANVRVVAWQGDVTRPVAAGIGNFLL